MAISGSIEIEGIEITGSYVNVSHFTYNNETNNYHINYGYNIFVNEEHRTSGREPLKHSKSAFFTTSSNDIFSQIYNDIRTIDYFYSSSLIDC